MTVNPDVLARYTQNPAVVTTSAKSVLSESIIGILGAPGTGKSTLLLTASKFYQGFPNPNKYDPITGEGIIKLSDIGIIQCDPGSTDGYRSAGYDVDIIRYRKILNGDKAAGIEPVQNPERAAEIAFALARQWPEKDFYGFDTVSQFDDDMFRYLQQNPALYMSKKGNEDTREMWNYLRSAHASVYSWLLELPNLKAFVGHTKALTDDLNPFAKASDKELTARKDKISLAGNASITLDVTGRSERSWIRINSLLIAVRAVENPQTRKLTRVLELEYASDVDIAVKNRFFGLPKNPEFNLLKVFNAVRGS